MKKYPSIETVFSRDKSNNLLAFGINRLPETELIKRWQITEKIDGMNMRVTVDYKGVLHVKGRGDNAQIPKDLNDHIHSIFEPEMPRIRADFLQSEEDWAITFYGEGYGGSIQSPMGMTYSQEKKFRCFDIAFGIETKWVSPDTCTQICDSLHIPKVPFLGYIQEIPKTKDAMHEIIPFSMTAILDSQSKVEAEGIVAKTQPVIYDQHGERVMWKLCFREFKDDV
jgi:hypothetical protein